MSAFLLETLIKTNLAAALAVVVILMARRLVLKFLGARAAYLSWSLLPVIVLAMLMPARSVEVVAPAVQLPTGLEDLSARGMHHSPPFDWLAAIAAPVLMVWLLGGLGMAVFFALRQRRFLLDMSLGLAGPAVVGFRRQRIVIPDDFTRRYSAAEQKLILAHEHVHLERHDARINALAALARCLCWFNPLVHVGAHAMRIDQELSCDAAVIERRPRARRAYAETLLKTQLAARPLPVGCYWPATIDTARAIHPFAERIDMLTRKPHSRGRRITASAAVLTLVLAAGAAAWAAQPERKIQSTIATPPLRAGEAPEILLPLQPISPNSQARLLTMVRLAPAPTPAPPKAITARPTLRADGKQPDYPSESIRLNEHGSVLVELCLDMTGKVISAKLIHSSGYQRLDEATLSWLKTEAFNPAIREGEPIGACGYRLQYDWSQPNEAQLPQPPQ